MRPRRLSAAWVVPMSGPPMTDVQQQGMAALYEAGMMNGPPL